MLVYITTGGSHGDVHPFLGIGCELARRGHEIIVFAHPSYASDIERAGLGHVPIGAEVDQQAVLRDPRLMHPRKGGAYVLKLVMNAVPGAVEVLGRQIASRRPDAVISHHICFGTRWVCEAARIPVAVAILAPLFWFSRSDPVPAPQRRLDRLDALRARLMMRAMRPLLPLVADRMLNGLRRQTGFPPQRGVMLRDTHGGDVNLGLWSRHFRPLRPRIRRPVASAAFRGTTAPTAASSSIPSSRRFSMVASRRSCSRSARRSCTRRATSTSSRPPRARLGRRGVLLTGEPDRARATCPPGSGRSATRRSRGCFRMAAQTVHHGGIGSTAQAIRAGRPSVVVPHAHDQFNNAVRVAKLGAGMLIDRRRLTVRRLAEILRKVLADEAIGRRCVELGAGLGSEDGSEAAADAVEELVRDRKGG